MGDGYNGLIFFVFSPSFSYYLENKFSCIVVSFYKNVIFFTGKQHLLQVFVDSYATTTTTALKIILYIFGCTHVRSYYILMCVYVCVCCNAICCVSYVRYLTTILREFDSVLYDVQVHV